MTETKNQPPKNNTSCIGCGGSGQTSFFGGASRFMFTWEDCPDCHGTGIILEDTASDTSAKNSKSPDKNDT